MIDFLKRSMSEMHAGGAEILDATIGRADAPKKIGAWTISTVSQSVLVKVKGGKARRSSTLLGISEDDGGHWTFFDLDQATKEQFDQLFPELVGKVVIPEKQPAVFEKD